MYNKKPVQCICIAYHLVNPHLSLYILHNTSPEKFLVTFKLKVTVVEKHFTDFFWNAECVIQVNRS